MNEPKKIYSFGPYTAWEGKLYTGDNRAAYVTGPDLTGRICPIASFWSIGEAVRWIKELHGEAEPKLTNEDARKRAADILNN